MDHQPNILREFLTACGHEITGGAEYQWRSYGSKARFLNCDNDRTSCYAIYDPETQVVYEIAVQTEDGGTANYRWINPDYLEAYKAEAKRQKVAWDNPADKNEPNFRDFRWRDTDTVEDICEKANAIRNGLPYNPDVIMTLHLDRDVIADLAIMAHERGMTLNEFVVEVLRQEVQRLDAVEKADKAARKAARKPKKG